MKRNLGIGIALILMLLLGFYYLWPEYEFRKFETVRSQVSPGTRISEIYKAWPGRTRPIQARFLLTDTGPNVYLDLRPDNLLIEEAGKPPVKYSSEEQMWKAVEEKVQASKATQRVRIGLGGISAFHFFVVTLEPDGRVSVVPLEVNGGLTHFRPPAPSKSPGFLPYLDSTPL